MSIVVKDLVKEYGAQRAVQSISFEVKKGEIVGFLGPNGAGKSTTLKMLTGYLTPTAGKAEVCGLDVSHHPLAIRKKIGYLAEQNALYTDLYVREYLSFIAQVQQVPDPKSAVETIIQQTGLLPEAHKTIGKLSKGYKQRVGLAAALIHNPEVLILDEPTSGLDPNQLAEIRSLIKAQGQTKTVLFSTHILQEVEAICDRVIIIHKGNIVANSPLSKLAEIVSLPRAGMNLEEIFRFVTSAS
jgi:ABC-2 type transport system ATP-binding protein